PRYNLPHRWWAAPVYSSYSRGGLHAPLLNVPGVDVPRIRGLFGRRQARPDNSGSACQAEGRVVHGDRANVFGDDLHHLCDQLLAPLWVERHAELRVEPVVGVAVVAPV